jgi:hypothetical protein
LTAPIDLSTQPDEEKCDAVYYKRKLARESSVDGLEPVLKQVNIRQIPLGESGKPAGESKDVACHTLAGALGN